jgi:hypothetical protein
MIEIPLSLVYVLITVGLVVLPASCYWTYWLGRKAQDPAKMLSAVQRGYDHGAKQADRAMDSCAGVTQAAASAIAALNGTLSSTIELAAVTNVPAATERMHNHTVSCLTRYRMAEPGSNGNGVLFGGSAMLPEEEHIPAGEL